MIWVYIGTHLLVLSAGFILGAWWVSRRPAPGPVQLPSTWDGARWTSTGGGVITSVWDAMRGVKR
jgi:hypothetical protein